MKKLYVNKNLLNKYLQKYVGEYYATKKIQI